MADDIFERISLALMVFYGLFIFISIVSIILVNLGYFKSIWKFKIVLHIFWVILAIITVLGFIVIAVLGILSIITMEGCIYADDVLNKPTTLDKLKLD